jgi:hypothetical protein
MVEVDSSIIIVFHMIEVDNLDIKLYVYFELYLIMANVII